LAKNGSSVSCPAVGAAWTACRPRLLQLTWGKQQNDDGRLLDVLESRRVAHRVDQTTHQDGYTLDVLVDVDDSGITSVSAWSILDFLVMSYINMRRPNPDV